MTDSLQKASVPTPFGMSLVVSSDGSAIVRAAFTRQASRTRAPISDALLRETARQVKAYFERKLPVFDLPLHFDGKPFENEVWRAVSTLQFGHFVSYGEVGHAIGRPRTHRLVAAAMGKSPIDLFVPAHRVIGADGKLKGCEPGSVRYKLAVFEGYGADPRK